MILGISILDDRLLLALHNGDEKEPELNSYLFSETLAETPEPGAIWPLAGDAAREIFGRADQLVLAVPSSACYLKRLELDGIYASENREYREWLAGIQLPGELSQYHHVFLPLRESFDNKSTEILFMATLAKTIDRLLTALKIPDDQRQIMILPEQLGLIKVLEGSLGKDDIPQAGIVNCDKNGAAAVYMKDGRFYHCHYFRQRPEGGDDLATDLETYFLSRADSTESLPLVISGFPSDFKTNWSPIVPAFLGIHHLEFAGAWGVAEYLISSEK